MIDERDRRGTRKKLTSSFRRAIREAKAPENTTGRRAFAMEEGLTGAILTAARDWIKKNRQSDDRWLWGARGAGRGGREGAGGGMR